MSRTAEPKITAETGIAATPADWGLPAKFKRWRPRQFETVLRVIDSVKRFFALCAPTGSGKSLTAISVAVISGRRTAVLTITKNLQDQYMDDFRAIGAVDIRGKASYECRLSGSEGRFTCEDGEHARCRHAKSPGCPYAAAFARASKAPIVITNYHYWCLIHQHGKGLGAFEMLMLDEAHGSPEALAGIVETEINDRALERVGIRWPVGGSGDTGEPTMDDWRTWAATAVEIVTRRVEQAKTEMEGEGGRISTYATRKLIQLKNLERSLTLVSQSEGHWEYERGRFGYRFAPLWPRQFAEPVLFRGIPHIVLASATVRPKTLDLIGIKPDAYEFAEIEATFDRDRMPVYYIPTIAMKYTATDDQLATMYRRICQIIRPRLDRKGIIHTVSYKRQGEIVLACADYAGDMIAPNSEELARDIKRFKRAEPPAILLSPAVTTGYDFPYNECEYQIVVKLPFPDTRSKIQKARQDADPEYGPYQMTQVLQQMCGRGSRADDDRCETFICDNQIEWVIWKFAKHFARWFYKTDSRGNQIGGMFKPIKVLPSPPPTLNETGPVVERPTDDPEIEDDVPF